MPAIGLALPWALSRPKAVARRRWFSVQMRGWDRPIAAVPWDRRRRNPASPNRTAQAQHFHRQDGCTDAVTSVF